MKAIHCIIVDDNELDRLLIEEYVQSYSELKLLGSFGNALECLSLIESGQVQVLFMDIRMPVISGVEFFKTLEAPPLCVFITSHVDYALEAFDLHAVDYLLKPVKKDRFEQSIRRVFELISIRQKAMDYDLSMDNTRLTIKEGNSINKVLISDIVYLEALTNYTKVVTTSGRHITLQNLKNFLDALPREKFIRIHRSYAVAVDKVGKLKSGEVTLGNISVPIGKTYRQNIIKLLSKAAS